MGKNRRATPVENNQRALHKFKPIAQKGIIYFPIYACDLTESNAGFRLN